jgi:hypothetical protein
MQQRCVMQLESNARSCTGKFRAAHCDKSDTQVAGDMMQLGCFRSARAMRFEEGRARGQGGSHSNVMLWNTAGHQRRQPATSAVACGSNSGLAQYSREKFSLLPLAAALWLSIWRPHLRHCARARPRALRARPRAAELLSLACSPCRSVMASTRFRLRFKFELSLTKN